MLPVNYKKLSFIENAESGSYIDTGHYATTDTKVVVDGCVIDGDTALFGSRKSMNANDCYALQFTSELYYRFSFNTSKMALLFNLLFEVGACTESRCFVCFSFLYYCCVDLYLRILEDFLYSGIHTCRFHSRSFLVC